MNITIRHLRRDDVEAVHRIFACESVIQGTMRLPYADIDYTQKRLEPANGAIRLVAVNDGEVIGFSELITYPNVPRHRHVGEINMLTVREDKQGFGVGRQLMDAMIELAEQWLQIRKLTLIVWEDNWGAIQLYEQLGFVIEGTMTDYAFREGDYINAHFMGRRHPIRPQKTRSAFQANSLATLAP